jgi:hypothetical protein
MTDIDAAITRARTALLVLLRDTATITHTPSTTSGRGGQTSGTPTTTTVAANVQRMLGADEQAVAERLGVVSPAIIRLPVGTVVASGDTITVSGQAFAVVTPLENTIDLTLKILAKEL